jgi:aminopeptidase-like protein
VRGIDWNSVPSEGDAGLEMYELMRELFPICRSLSGNGVRETLDIISQYISLTVTEVPTGTKVFDWTVPKEWNINAAWIADSSGKRIVDFERCNLHVLGYSAPVRSTMPLSELRDHLFIHRTNPDWIPFRTSYYDENWGFCLSRRQLDAVEEGSSYEVCIDSTLSDGSITYGEAVIGGEEPAEVLLSTYICHPSLCNDNLSGIVLLAIVGKYLSRMPLRYSYRLLFSPGTIGPISWLARNEDRLHMIAHGLVASCVGDPGPPTYKKSRRGNAEIDRAVATVLRDRSGEHTIREFTPLGGDERQFCSPGINLPVGALSRTPADEFPEYHSSGDNFELVQPEHLGESFGLYLRVLDVLEQNAFYVNKNPKGEPQLGKRGLYRTIGGGPSREASLLWVLNLSDGTQSLLDIAERSRIPFPAVRQAALLLEEHGLLEEAREGRSA